MAELLQKDLCQHAAPPRTAAASVPETAAGHCQPTPLPETPTHRQGWLSLLWCPYSFLLEPGMHKILFMPSKSVCFSSPVEVW